MKASDYICNFLKQQGVKQVFELSGGMITHLLDSIARDGGIRCVSVHHEQSAAFAAEAVGRMTGIPGIALATSGPGATNLLTGIGSCYFDSSPAIFITGQVNRHEQKGNRAVRQLGFQETDIVSMAQPITKAAWRVENAEALPQLLQRAFSLAAEGRPGPVLLDLPMDVQRSELDVRNLGTQSPELSRGNEFQEDLSRLFQDAKQAQRPLILAGGGVRSGRVTELFKDFVEAMNIPVVHSLMGVDVLPYAHPLRVGMIGTYGNRWANFALGKSDFVLVLGSRLDVRQTGSEVEEFARGRKIYHVDCDSGEVNNRVKGCIPFHCTLSAFLKAALQQIASASLKDNTGWAREIAYARSRWPDQMELSELEGINPNALMHAVSAVSQKAGAYVTDVGQHQMWAAQSLELKAHQRFLTSGGMGSMGFALPAAIGVACATPGQPVIAIAGDGGFQCNIQELQTVFRNQLPIKMLVLNNHCHGMVRQFQESYFEGRYQSTVWGYSSPEFTKVAAAYGIESRRVSAEANIENCMDWLWKSPNTPMLLEVEIDPAANVYPKIAFGRPITEMEPDSKPLEMEST